MKKIAIIGGSGFIGTHVTKKFLAENFKVKVSATDISKKEKYQHLMNLANADNLEIRSLNTEDVTALKDFIQDSEILIHCGTPFQLEVEDAQKELFDPTIKGTENLLKIVQESKAVVKKGNFMTMTQEKASWGAAIAATLLILLVAMDQVMMPIATSAITKEFSTDAGAVQALIALMSLVAAPLYIAGGKLGDIHGKKKIFMAGLVLYGIGTLTATLAPNVTILMGGWSVVRALGMVLTIPASIGLLIASYPDEGQRGQAFAIYGVGAVTAALIGPPLMGLSADALSWRVPFGLETVIVAVTFFLTMRAMKETEPIEGAKVDWGGTAITFVAVASIILGSMLGGRYGWWLARRPFMLGETQFNPFGLSPAPLLMIFGGIVIAILLARLNSIEEKGGQPLFSMKLFDNRTFLTASLMATVFFILSGSLPFLFLGWKPRSHGARS